jgi:ribosomal protein S18 acetylase RimI-like enzyme
VDVGAEAVSPADVEIVRRGLRRYNMSQLDVPHAPFAVIARDAAGAVLGGVTGYVQWGMCEIEFAWVHDAWRGQGIGRQLMAAAEQVALAHGCRRMHLDTMSFQAPGFYRKLGYVVAGTIDGYAEGAVRYFLVKDLTP